jgi:N-acetylmuramoyl-L-alanine amidase/Mg-chelatase subunit ChlD
MNTRSSQHSRSRLFFLLSGLLLLVLLTPERQASAQAGGYDAAFLTDAELENYQSMDTAAIRQFLVRQNSYFSQPIADVDGQPFDPPERIAAAAQQHRINPQVLLATLQKEQTGVTQTTRPSDNTLRHLMGCAQPSTAREQITCAAERFRAYHDRLAQQGATVSGWRVGVAKETQDGVWVSPATRAVAGQFTYTPYAGAQWGGNDPRWGGVYLFCKFWNEFGFGSQGCDGGSSAPPPPPVARSCIVGLDPGHGGSDPGAIRDGIREADIVWDLSVRTRDILIGQGYQVIFSREQNVTPSFADRVATIRRGGGQFIVSIHTNAHNTETAHGVEAWYQGANANRQAAESRRLAQALTDAVSQQMGLTNRGIKLGQALYAPDMPSALIELAFLSNAREREMLVNQPDRFAAAVAQAIMTYGQDFCAAVAPPSPPTNSATTTVLIFDASGSMRGSKLAGAQQAGRNILDIIVAENEALSGPRHHAAIVAFSSHAEVIAPLSDDVPTVRTFLPQLRASGFTAMADGLQAGIQVLDGDSSSSGRSILILLSDGLPNVGLGGNSSVSEDLVHQEILTLADEARSKGYCLYTVGFGSAADLDEQLLREMSNRAGCGDYYYAQDVGELANVYVALRHSSTGEIRLQQTGQIAQGERVEIGHVAIPANEAQLLFTINWPGSRLDPLLADPHGRQVTPDYPGATLSLQPSIATVLVDQPMAGEWLVGASGVDVPGNSTTFHAVVSTRVGSGSTVPASNLGLWLMAGGLVLFTGVMWYQNRRHTGWYVTVLEENGRTQQFPIRRKGMWIGRSRTCQVRVEDPTVSARHCWVGVSRSRGTLYVRDNQSRSGIRRNDRKIEQAGFDENDVIHIGQNVQIRAARHRGSR